MIPINKVVDESCECSWDCSCGVCESVAVGAAVDLVDLLDCVRSLVCRVDVV